MRYIIALLEIGTTSKAGIGTAEDVGWPLLAGPETLHYTNNNNNNIIIIYNSYEALFFNQS